MADVEFDVDFGEVTNIGGVTSHKNLTDRDANDQHPISAITGLTEALEIASPTVSVETITGGHQVTITDKEGEHEFNVMDGLNGSDGADGKDGADGQDGYSPIVSITAITDGHAITITDASGDHSFDVFDGADGQDGAPGQNGADGKDGKDGTNGQDGQDGYSPTVSTASITGGTQVIITDKNGAHTFNVMNGVDGDDYVITQNDYNAIAQVVLGLLPIYNGSVSNGGTA